mgnify:CR=1 FL=1
MQYNFTAKTNSFAGTEAMRNIELETPEPTEEPNFASGTMESGIDMGDPTIKLTARLSPNAINIKKTVVQLSTEEEDQARASRISHHQSRMKDIMTGAPLMDFVRQYYSPSFRNAIGRAEPNIVRQFDSNGKPVKYKHEPTKLELSQNVLFLA